MLAKNTIPPQPNYKSPNPEIHWDEYNMRVPTKVEDFTTRNASGKRLVSMCVMLYLLSRPSPTFFQKCLWTFGRERACDC
jgi:hypothetical protein